MICPWNFNEMLQEEGSKLRVDFKGFQLHWRWYEKVFEGERISVLCDKLSGLKRYKPFLAQSYMVSVLKERGEESVYLLRGYSPESKGFKKLELRFVKGGDELIWLISIASILGKYLRELAMSSLSKAISEALGKELRISGYYDEVTSEVLRKIDFVAARMGLPVKCLQRER